MAKEFESKELNESVEETKSGERIFDADGFGKVSVRFPNYKEKQLAEIEYSKKFTELIDTNLKTRAEMEEVLKKRGIWTEKEEAKVDRLQKELVDAFEKVAKAKSEKARQKALESVNELKREIGQTQNARDTYMNQTVESKAEDVRMGYLVASVATYAETGEKVWKTFDDFINEKNESGLYDIALEFMNFINGLPSSFLEQSPAATEQQEENGGHDGE